MPMRRDEIERMGAGMMEMALDNLQRDGYVAFATMLVSGASITPVMLDRVDAEQKQLFGKFLRGIASTGQFDAIAIISEAWTLDPTVEVTLPLTAPVSEHPARKEGVFVQMSSKEGNLLLTSHFDRDMDGKPVRQSEVRVDWQPTAAVPVGNFAGLFA
eukprot:2689685-Prymnesium_polylepis.1